jgi:abnormal spindle-like microcephaly-associated protein
MCILRNRFRSMKHAAFNIQALFRGQKERSYRSHLNRQATVIQTAWRCFSSFVKYTLDYGDIVISQSAARRFLARRASLEKRNAVLVLQSVARRYKASLTANEIRQELREQRRMNQSAQCIQAFYRGSVVRQFMWWKNSQASLIQAQYRGRIARVLYELERYDIIIVQSLIRRWLALRAAARTQGCTVKLQSYARMWLAKGTLRQLHMKQQMEMAENVAAVVLQKTYRGYLALRNISALHSMATGIQTSFRRHYWSLWYQMYLVDVVVAQSHVRRWLTRRWFMKAKTCVAILQSKARQLVATREVSMIRTKKKLWENRTLACLNIQRAWRGHVSRKLSTKHASARKIQKTWRCFAAHVDYLVQQIAVIRLQAQFRKYRTQKAYMGTKASLVKFQAVTRGVVERKYLCFLSMSVTRIQTCFRGYSRRVMFGRMRSSATLIQGLVRGFIVRDELEVSHFAAAEIQRVWRGFAQFCDFFVRLDSVIKLQTFFRRVNAVRKCEDLKLAAYADRCFFDKKARIIQSGFRTYVHHLHLSRSAALVQNMARRYIHRRRATRFERGVKRLQAVFRAKATRRRRTKKVTAVVTRLDRANLKARKDPKLQIGYKTRHALNILQNSKSLAEIMDAVKSLETSTRLSSLCCVLFTEADAARILLDLIRSCNRSVPHVELVHCILLTLDNVSQYRQLVASFATCYSAEIFLDKMQMFRDKDGIFCLSVSLLHGIANCNPMVEEFCALHEHLKRLKALHGLSLRRARPSHTTTKRETNKKPNRIKRRENFDRNAAIKVLGVMVDRFEAVVVSPAEVAGRQHFTF